MPHRTSLRLGAFLRREAYHTHGLLRGLAQFARDHPGVEILKLPQPRRFSPTTVRELRLDGLLARVTTAADERVLAELAIPVVNVSGARATPRLAWLNTDDARVGRMAWRHLADRGHRHFGYVGNRTHLASQRRHASLQAAVQGTGGSWAEFELAREHEESPFPGPIRRRLCRWLTTLPRPIGLLGFNDRVALEIAAACALAGLSVPEHVAIIGVGNDLTRLEFSPIAITSIELPTHQLGYQAMAWLTAMARGRRETGERLLVPPKIVTRRSTDALAVDDEVVAVAIDHAREHIANTLYVDDLARAARVSRRVLEKRCRKALGKSVYAVVQELRIDRAKELMATPGLTLAEVAYAAGFENQRHLSLAFRRLAGVPPSVFRAQLR